MYKLALVQPTLDIDIWSSNKVFIHLFKMLMIACIFANIEENNFLQMIYEI